MKKEYYGYCCLIITMLLFSSYEVVNKTLVGEINPIEINFIRFLFGGLLLMIFVYVKEGLAIGKKDFLQVSAVGVINVAISMTLLQLGLFLPGAKASIVAVIFSSNPIFVTIFSAVFEKEEIKPYKIIGLLMGMAGIFIVFLQGMQLSKLNIASPLLAFLSAVTFALYTVMGKKVSSRIGSLKMNAYSFIMGSIILLPFLIIFKVPVMTVKYIFTPQILYLSFLVTGVAYLTYFIGLSIVGASTGSLVFFSKPVLASFLAIVFLHEKATVNLFVGTAFIILGILLVIFWDKNKQKN